MSALTHWSPIIGEVEFMPKLVLKLLMLIPHDDLYVLELTMSLIMHWMQTWFEAYPSEPVDPIKAVEAIIYAED